MFEHNLDPIPFLENAKAQLPYSASVDAQEHNAAPQLSLTEMQDRKHLLKIAQLYVNSPYILGALVLFLVNRQIVVNIQKQSLDR